MKRAESATEPQRLVVNESNRSALDVNDKLSWDSSSIIKRWRPRNTNEVCV
jgi:hypothetical protein